MINILVLCTGNSCRSQMAHGFLQKLFGEKANIFSAGIERHGLNPYAVKVMKECGINISNHTSNLVNDYAHIHFNHVITVCDHANESCPIFHGQTQRLHRSFCDPSKATYHSEEDRLSSYRTCRDQIQSFCEKFYLDNYKG